MQAEEEPGGCQALQPERSPRGGSSLWEESLEQSWVKAALPPGLDICEPCCQGKLSQPQGHECGTEKQSLDLLQHQCQILKDQLFCYEEGTQELELAQRQEREQHRREQLAQAKRRVSLLESMLGLYRQKYQASLGRAGELESQQQRLAEELAAQAKVREEAALKTHSQQQSLQEELQGKGRQLARAEDTIARLVQELRGAQEELAQGQQQFEETIQDLQQQLAASHAKFLDQEAALAAVQRDFAAYQSAHAHSNSRYERQAADTESLQQRLLQVEGKSSEHQRQAEEYQALVQDLKRELVRVAEQKKGAAEDVARLELDLQSARQEAAAERERRQLEAAEEQQRVQLLEAELQQSRQLCALREQAALQEARQHQQKASQLEERLERLKGLQQQWLEERQKVQSLQSTVGEQEAENQALREQLRQHTTQLEAAHGNLEGLQLRLQQQAAEGLKQEAALSQLHTELHRAQERERQSSQTLTAAEDIARDLQRQVASCQASQREALQQLEERGREVFRLHADLQLSQHKEAHLEEELAASREQAQQLRSQVQALQRQQEQEACSSEERLGEREQEVRHWQEKHQAAQHDLAGKDEELVVLKVELATLKEKWHTAAAEVQSLEGERAVTQRLLQESELMEANVSQWVKEQRQAKEKLALKIREQIKHIAQLTGERDHLQGMTERLQRENKQLRSKVDELHVEQERFKAIHSKAWDPRAGQRQPRPGINPPRCLGQRQSTDHTAEEWDGP